MFPHRFLAQLSLALALAAPARAGNIPLEEPPKRRPAPASHALDVAWQVLVYLPNRLFDLTDVVRVQVRAGPGWAVGARATRLMPVFLGGYKATWVGLPGPRGRASLPLPFGIQSQTGLTFGPSLTGNSQSPNYGRGELGGEAQAYILGFNVGFDVVELADFFAGFAGVDFSHDDF
jgi:hypothetical protein